jgi:hypothetical protein
MDEELKAYLAAMEERLVGRINDGNEPILNRLAGLEGEVRALGLKTDVAREISFRVPKLVVEALEAGLLPRLIGIEEALAAIRRELGQLRKEG